MELKELGFDDWFGNRIPRTSPPEHHPARVTTVDRGSWLVRNETGEAPAELSGKLRFSSGSPADLPCVGDWVLAQHHNDGRSAIIHEVLPRRTSLRRKHPGKDSDAQMIAANIDLAFILQSCHYDFNLRRFDRYLVMARDGGIEPVLVLTKIDLITPEDLQAMLAAIRERGIAARVLALSNATGEGLEEFSGLLAPGRTCCLMGSSGVGKTTIINRLLGREVFDTREVSATGEGTHTTSRRQLILVPPGAMLIDTPGMRELGIVASEEVLEDSFADIHELAADCRYVNCGHLKEAGCAVLQAVEDGRLEADRHRSYLKLMKEAAFHELSYVEKRKKDKAFGKFVKSAMKELKK